MTEIENNETIGMDSDYIDQINELKATTVSKADYEKLRNENKKLLNSLVKGDYEQESVVLSKPSNDELRRDLFNSKNEMTNLEYVTKALQLRNNILEETGKDIFVASNSVYTPTQESYECANRVAQVFEECIEYANGDSEVFTNELMRRTDDVKLPGLR